MGKIFDAIEKSTRSSGLKKKMRAQKPSRPKSINRVVPIHDERPTKTSNLLDPLLITYHEPDSIESEAFKILKTNILFPKEGKSPRTILVTSTSPGEGKTFVSANLAISVALGVEDYVLLVDGDLRRSNIQERFGYKNAAGLSEYLANTVPLESVMLKTAINKLSVLGGGNPPPNPTELLSSKKMADLIQELKNRYNDRYIIIDSPPPAAASETIALSKQVDGIILVVKERGDDRKLVKNTIEMIQSEKLIGVVFNWSQRKIKQYKGYYKPNIVGK